MCPPRPISLVLVMVLLNRFVDEETEAQTQVREQRAQGQLNNEYQESTSGQSDRKGQVLRPPCLPTLPAGP